MYAPPIQIELPTLYGMRTVNAYLFTKPEVTLVDCGEKTPKSWQTLVSKLEEHDLSVKDIQQIIITHAHVDHMGMAAEICRHSDAQVWVSDYVHPWAVDVEGMWQERIEKIGDMIRAYLSGTPKGEKMLQLFAHTGDLLLRSWENVPTDRLQRFAVDDILTFGGREWDVLHMPGHCNHQTCFWHATSGDFLSADMLLRITPTPVIELSIHPPYEREKGILQLLASFEKLKKLDIKQVYPGHYAPFDNPQEIIRQQIDRIHNRKEACMTMINSGITNFYELFEQMYGERLGVVAFPMMIGYIDLLQEEGRIIQSKENGMMTINSTQVGSVPQ